MFSQVFGLMISQLDGACVQNKLQLQSIAAVQNMEQVERCSLVFIQGDENSSMVEKVVEYYVVVWFSPQLNVEYGTGTK